MRTAPVAAAVGATLWSRWRRLLVRWWRLQTPARQDRFVTMAPLISVLLFLAAIISAFWYLRNEEMERETETVKRDTEIAQQQIRLHLSDNQEQLTRLAGELARRESDSEAFLAQAATFVRERPTVTQMAWLGNDRARRAAYWAMPFRADASGVDGDDPSLPQRNSKSAATQAFERAREQRQPVYSLPFRDETGNPVFELQVPLVARNTVSGTLMLEYSIEALMRHYVPPEVSRRHSLLILDAAGHTLAGTVTPMPDTPASRRSAIVYDVPLAPAMNGLVLRGQGFRTSIGLISNTLFWMVVALSVLTVWMLLGSWRHLRRRAQIQSALVQETNFRRAMENSMLTGMRAMDLEGRITYVNAAFCAMTGFNEATLIGRLPPFPYWPHDRIDENNRLLQQELRGRSPAGGIEVHVMRKDSSLFDARMYVSPLIDPRGQQTGWMTSMTNITEAKRIRDQLSASHERFTTVLEGLDASVSVLSVPQGELLFANRSYRLWFGTDAGGHALLTGSIDPAAYTPDAEDLFDGLSGLPTEQLTESGSDPREVHVAPLHKWFDVRSRYLQWTDGRLAQMVIATDISARQRADEQAALQAERAQVTSRLVTMGEMASSVAHELNQPLTAITNYCNGMVSRVESDTIRKDDLLAALRKTARQAERAGQTIRRIRAFVKKSEPVRQSAQARQIVEDAVELAGIELRRRNVAIHTYIAQRLPTLQVDPILIEQVLMNLLKNAAEAIDGAQLPPSRRRIDLRVVPRHTSEEGGVIEFSVADSGPGLQGEIITRLYEAFFSTKAEGLGIGLSLCRSIVESHQGRMRAQNTYNGDSVSGCRFSFTLPVHLPVRDDRSDPMAAAQPVSNPSVAS